MRLSVGFFTSFLLYVGQVYWLHEVRKARRAAKARIFFITSGLKEQKYQSFKIIQIVCTKIAVYRQNRLFNQ